MIMAGHSSKLLVFFLVFLAGLSSGAFAAIPKEIMRKIELVNREGPWLGITVPSARATNEILCHTKVTLPPIDFAGKRFHFAHVQEERVRVIVVMTGNYMLNAGTTTKLLLALFNVRAVLHLGIAGSADPKIKIGDVTIPLHWAHSGLWCWQRYGEDKLPSGCIREIGYLNISDYNVDNKTENLLSNVWYQKEEIFPVNGTPEVAEYIFWVPVNVTHNELARISEDFNVVIGENGVSANIYLDNEAYRDFLHSKFNATTVDMEAAAVGLVCYQQNIPFLAIEGVSDLAGGGPAPDSALAIKHAVLVLIELIPLLCP